MMNIAGAWQIRGVAEGVAEGVAHLTTKSLHQYYTLVGDKIVACDGAGNLEPPSSAGVHRLEHTAQDSVRRALRRGATISAT